jgi:tetratricopeptide (TPR) repeat protein
MAVLLFLNNCLNSVTKYFLKILKQLIKLDPNNQQETFNEMGVMYGRINQYNKAKIYYQKSIEKSSKTNYGPYLNLFEISLITKKPFYCIMTVLSFLNNCLNFVTKYFSKGFFVINDISNRLR